MEEVLETFLQNMERKGYSRDILWEENIWQKAMPLREHMNRCIRSGRMVPEYGLHLTASIHDIQKGGQVRGERIDVQILVVHKDEGFLVRLITMSHVGEDSRASHMKLTFLSIDEFPSHAALVEHARAYATRLNDFSAKTKVLADELDMKGYWGAVSVNHRLIPEPTGSLPAIVRKMLDDGLEQKMFPMSLTFARPITRYGSEYDRIEILVDRTGEDQLRFLQLTAMRISAKGNVVNHKYVDVARSEGLPELREVRQMLGEGQAKKDLRRGPKL